MPFDPLSTTTAALTFIGITAKTAAFGFNVKSVPAQTSEILITIDQVRSDISFAKTLRRHTSAFLHQSEKDRVDETIENTEHALATLAVLVERPRVDMMVNRKGHLSYKNRILWILQDAGSVATTLARLNTVNSSLQTQILFMTLLNRSKAGNGAAGEKHVRHETEIPPPRYEATNKIIQMRRQSTRRRYGRDKELENTSNTEADPNYLVGVTEIWEENVQNGPTIHGPTSSMETEASLSSAASVWSQQMNSTEQDMSSSPARTAPIVMAGTMLSSQSGPRRRRRQHWLDEQNPNLHHIFQDV